jgi:hypothetical protein
MIPYLWCHKPTLYLLSYNPSAKGENRTPVIMRLQRTALPIELRQQIHFFFLTCFGLGVTGSPHSFIACSLEHHMYPTCPESH